MVYIISIGETVCVQLGQDDFDIADVCGCRYDKLCLRSWSGEELECTTDQIIDSMEVPSDEEEEAEIDIMKEDDDENEELYAAQCESWTEELSSTALLPHETHQINTCTVSKLAATYLESRDITSTFETLPGYTDQRSHHVLISQLLHSINSHKTDAPSLGYIVDLYLLVSFLSRLNPAHAVRYMLYIQGAVDVHRSFYETCGIDEILHLDQPVV